MTDKIIRHLHNGIFYRVKRMIWSSTRDRGISIVLLNDKDKARENYII